MVRFCSLPYKLSFGSNFIKMVQKRVSYEDFSNSQFSGNAEDSGGRSDKTREYSVKVTEYSDAVKYL